MKPPKQKAISSTWMRWSFEMEETEERTVSKFTGAHGDAVEPHSHEHNPADGPGTGEEAGEHGARAGGNRQAEDGATDDEGRGWPIEAAELPER